MADSDVPSRNKVAYDRGEGITGKVLENKRSQVIPRVLSEPASKDRIHKRGRQQKSKQPLRCVDNARPSPKTRKYASLTCGMYASRRWWANITIWDTSGWLGSSHACLLKPQLFEIVGV